MENFTTTSSSQTKKLAKKLAQDFRGGEIICLSGDLGAGKTTFTQGLLEALGAEGPYTSPTFAIIKHYHQETRSINREKESHMLHDSCSMIHDIYHIDAYRIGPKDLQELGFSDFAGKPGAVTIIEWPENVKDMISDSAICISFEWIKEKERRITFI